MVTLKVQEPADEMHHLTDADRPASFVASTSSRSTRGRPDPRSDTMPRFLIERDLPGASKMTDADRIKASKSSCRVVADLAPRLQWEHTYWSGDKVFCVFHADGEDAVREHGERGGFPITAIHRVGEVTDPTTAER
jgi:hypothetical protein